MADIQSTAENNGGGTWWDQFNNAPGSGFSRSTTDPAASLPSGVPDPANPGYDTHGYKLGSKTNADGTVSVPNNQGGVTTTDPNTLAQTTTSAPAPSNGPGNVSPLPAPPSIAPFSYAAWDKTFQAPTADEAADTPGYQDALKQAQQALARSAAAKGTLLTGGTAKALQQQAVAYANQNYQNVYNNALTKYNTDFSTYQQGLLNALNVYSTNAGLSNQEYQQLLQAYGLSNQVGLGYGQLGLGYANLNSANINAANQLGLGYAGLQAQILGNGANAYTNYLTQGANARAAGSIGAGNAWSGIPSSLSNGLTTAAIYGGSRPPAGNGLPGYQASPTPPPSGFLAASGGGYNPATGTYQLTTGGNGYVPGAVY